MGSTYPMKHHFIGACPTVLAKIGGNDVTCLVDTGTMVSTLTEESFHSLFKPCDTQIHNDNLWLRITSAEWS